MKEEFDIFVQLAALADAAALSLEHGSIDTATGVVYVMKDILEETLSYYPNSSTEK